CGAGRSCIPDAPFGWEGPVALNREDDAGGPQTCPGDLPLKIEDLKADYDAGSASCSCSCGTATGWSCGSTGPLSVRDSHCNGGITDSANVGTGCADLDINNGQFIVALSPTAQLNGASCPPSNNHSISNAGFGLDAIACQGNGFAC